MNGKPISEGQYFITWLLFYLCSAVGGIVVGGIAGAITGALLYGVKDMPIFKLACGMAGFIAGMLVSYAFFRLFVDKLIVKKIINAGNTPT